MSPMYSHAADAPAPDTDREGQEATLGHMAMRSASTIAGEARARGRFWLLPRRWGYKRCHSATLHTAVLAVRLAVRCCAWGSLTLHLRGRPHLWAGQRLLHRVCVLGGRPILTVDGLLPHINTESQVGLQLPQPEQCRAQVGGTPLWSVVVVISRAPAAAQAQVQRSSQWLVLLKLVRTRQALSTAAAGPAVEHALNKLP